MWAIAKTIGALRGIERWGAKEMVNAAFRGFKALPMGGDAIMTATPHQVLGVAPGASKEEITAAYKELAKKYHPDVGGDHSKFVEIKNAYELLIG